MRRNAAIIVMGVATACAVSVLAQGRGNQAAPYVPPAFDTYTPNIPGVVAAGTRVELITDTINGTEGPVAMPDGSLVFTEGGARRLTRIDAAGALSPFLENIQSSGLGFDQQGRMIANNNADGKQGIYVVYPKGAEATLVDRKTPGFEGANDLVVDRKGGVYFTQPNAGNVGYVSPGGKGAPIVADAITRPNGIQVYSPQGRHLGTIPTGRVINNLAFAGQDKKLLYLVGRGAAWKIRMIAQGYKGRAK